jgi:hypothetical protein
MGNITLQRFDEMCRQGVSFELKRLVAVLVVAAYEVTGGTLTAQSSIGGIVGGIRGTVATCRTSADAVRLAVLSSRGSVHVAVSDRDVPLSSSYAQVVTRPYRVEGTCPQAGEQVRVTGCERCRPPRIDAVELGGRTADFDEAQSTLWIVRQFFDDTVYPKGYPDFNLVAASMVVARHNRRDGGNRAL